MQPSYKIATDGEMYRRDVIRVTRVVVMEKEDIKQEHCFILNILYIDQCFSRKHPFHGDKIRKFYMRRSDHNIPFKKAIKDLKNLGLIAPSGKSPEKYYISDSIETISILDENGFNVTRGSKRG